MKHLVTILLILSGITAFGQGKQFTGKWGSSHSEHERPDPFEIAEWFFSAKDSTKTIRGWTITGEEIMGSWGYTEESFMYLIYKKNPEYEDPHYRVYVDTVYINYGDGKYNLEFKIK